MERDRDKELQDLLQIAHQNGVPVIPPEPVQSVRTPGCEVRIVVLESGTEIENADS
jgi:hypothetical protein